MSRPASSRGVYGWTEAMLGVPYGDAVKDAPGQAHAQAATIAADLVAQGGYKGLEGKKVIALVAYLQRLGTDISAPVAQK